MFQSGNYDYLGHIVGLVLARLLIYVLPLSLNADMSLFSFALSLGLLTMILYKNDNIFFAFITILSGVMLFQQYAGDALDIVINLLAGGLFAYLYVILLATYNITLYNPDNEKKIEEKKKEEIEKKKEDPFKCALFKNNILVKYV
jgi:hypothetical protein